MSDLYSGLRDAGLEINYSEAAKLEKQLRPYLGFEDYPQEILEDIAAKLPYSSIIALCLSNTAFQYRICDNEQFWRILYKQLSDRTRGVDFKKEYHAFTTPLFGSYGYPNTNAWSPGARRFVNNQYLKIDPAKVNKGFFEILQALDHKWEKRVNTLIVEYEPKWDIWSLRRYVQFLLVKDDFDTLKWFISSYILTSNLSKDDYNKNLETLQAMAADSAHSVNILNYLFYDLGDPVPRDQNEFEYLQYRQSLQDIAAEFGNAVSADYIFKLYPPTAEEKDDLIELAVNNFASTRVLRNLN